MDLGVGRVAVAVSWRFSVTRGGSGKKGSVDVVKVEIAHRKQHALPVIQ
jgi:hypothetical protein